VVAAPTAEAPGDARESRGALLSADARLASVIVYRSGLRPGVAFDGQDLNQQAHLQILKLRAECPPNTKTQHSYAFLHFRSHFARDLKRKVAVKNLGDQVFDLVDPTRDPRIEDLVEEYAGRLTSGHRWIVRLIAHGYGKRQIARLLRIPYRTVLMRLKQIKAQAA
jgi:DNA-directed RNA polymerase specialized sigma24 family protein